MPGQPAGARGTWMSGTGGKGRGPEAPDDPLAPWRLAASWPEEEWTLWQERLDKADGDEAEAERLLAAEAARMDPEARPWVTLRLWSVLLRRDLAALGEEDAICRDAARWTVRAHYLTGQFRRGVALALRVLSGRAALLGEQHRHTLTSMDDLATLMRASGQRREAKDLAERGLALRRAMLGEDDPDTLTSLNTLADCHAFLGEYRRARPLYEQALQRRREVLGKDHPDTLTSIDALADCHRGLGEAQRALQLCEQGLERCRAVFGEDHPASLTSLNRLARCYLAIGDARQALRLLEITLVHRCAVLGEDHPATLNTLNNLAYCHARQGNVRRALPIYERALERRAAVLGQDHPAVRDALNNVAFCHKALGDPWRALPIYELVLERRRAVLGDNNPSTLLSLHNVATCHQALGDAERALPLFGLALKRRRAIHGKNHPRTLVTLHALACSHLSLGHAERALPLFEEALGRRRTVLGEDHPETINTMHEIVLCCEALGRVADAASMVRELLQCLARSGFRIGLWLQVAGSIAPVVSRLLSGGASVEWRAPFGAISAAYVEDLDLTEPEAVDHLLPSFVAFHDGWLGLCLSNTEAAEDIPLVLSAIQGRETAAMMLADLEAREAYYPEDDLRRRYLEVIRELRRLRMILRAQGADDALGGDDAGPARGESDPPGNSDGGMKGTRRQHASPDQSAPIARAASRAQVQSEHDALLAEMQRLRAEIGRGDRTFRLAYARPDVSVGSLAAKLDPVEALVLLFAQVSKDTMAVQHHACCITADGVSRLVLLPLLPTAHRRVCVEVSCADLPRGGDRRGLHELDLLEPSETDVNPSVVRENETAAPADVAEGRADLRWVGPGGRPQEAQVQPLTAQLAEALWQPLRAVLPDIRRWHLATHHALHILPTHLGADPDHQVFAHPGLLFFWQHRNRTPEPMRAATPPLLALHEDAALATKKPIPFVAAETALIRAIWGKDNVTVSTGAATRRRLGEATPPLDILVFAAHGEEVSGPPRQTIVHLDKAQGLRLDTTDVLGAAQRPRAVLISACVAGRVSEDPTGEPLGLVSAFFLNGAEFVLAPLLPIPDFHAPIFMGLFHLAWRDGGDPHRAWRSVRQQAASGTWPAGFDALLCDAYAPAMDQVLQRVAASPEELDRLNGWPLPIKPAMARRDPDAFIRAYCAAPKGRKKLIAATLKEMITRRNRLAPALRLIGDWTVAFGA